MTALALTISAILAQGAPATPPGAAPPPVRESRSAAPESIGSLLAEPAPSGERAPTTGGAFFQMLGWVAALGVLALAAVRVWRRLAARGAPGADGGGLRVVSRAALTPRHFIYTVRVGSQRLLVVGVSGDRITALSEFDDPAQVLALDSAFQKSLERAGGPEAAETGEEARLRAEGDLSPYRREVQRLSELVRGWRRAAGGWGKRTEGGGTAVS